MRRSAWLAGLLIAVALGGRPAAAQPRQVGVLFAPGWNNFGYVGATRPVEQALLALTGLYESVWTWDAAGQRWLGHTPAAPFAGDFTELRQNQAYWIRMTARGELAMDVPPEPAPVTLAAGWNNFVFPGSEQPVGEALAAAAGRYDSVWRWDASRQYWTGATPDSPFASDFTSLGPNRVYFMRLTAGPPIVMTFQAVPFVTPTPTRTLTPTPGPTTTAPTPAATPRATSCRSFQSYQPQLSEVGSALTRAAFGSLTPDPDLALKDLETQPDGSGRPVAPYIPPTLLKAIAWVETGWRQATIATARGATGPTITSSSCAYGLMQMLTGMDVSDTPSARQIRIASDYITNIAAGAQLLGSKWNFAPERLPVVLPRNPRALENWYYAVWAYHCFGEVCQALAIHNNPDDPTLKWPRPAYNSPDQLASAGAFGFTDYPYQELVYGVIAYPPRQDGAPMWPPLPVSLPPRGAIGYPEPRPFLEPSTTLDPTLPP